MLLLIIIIHIKELFLLGCASQSEPVRYAERFYLIGRNCLLQKKPDISFCQRINLYPYFLYYIPRTQMRKDPYLLILL